MDNSEFKILPVSKKAEESRDEAMSKLVYYRKLRGLSQSQLSELSGVNKMTISKIERGVAQMGNVTLANATALAKALGVDTKDLI